MNGEEESHWFSGTSQEPMGMKGMEGWRGEPPPPKKDSGWTIIVLGYVQVKRGTVNLWEFFWSFFF